MFTDGGMRSDDALLRYDCMYVGHRILGLVRVRLLKSETIEDHESHLVDL